MPILIADSGSTKTDWVLIRKTDEPMFFQTAGLNPYFTTEEGFKKIFESEVIPHIDALHSLEIFFYGAGCGNETQCNWIDKQLMAFCPSKFETGSDLLGAARALLQNDSGIACILGTGSNAGVYSDGKILRTAPSLGYILGDEGGGAWLGKQLLTAYLRQDMPLALHDAFDQMFHTNLDEILQKIYREPSPNRYLGRFVRFISTYQNDSWIKAMLVDAFSLFFRRYILPLEPAEGTTVGITGGVAVHFKDVLNEVAATFGFPGLLIEPSPINGLVRYHTTR